jgi:hypothetical protein
MSVHHRLRLLTFPMRTADASNGGQTRGIPGSDAIHLRVMCSSTPAGRQYLATLHMLRSAISDSLRSRGFIISWLNHTPHATAVYASCSALPPPHATLASRRLATPYLGRTCTGWIAPALPGAFHFFDQIRRAGLEKKRLQVTRNFEARMCRKYSQASLDKM